MLEKIDLEKRVEKETYKKVSGALEARLGALQRELKDREIPVIIVFEGLGAAGKGTQINRLIQPLDPRGFDVFASRIPGSEEKMRPFLYRYWAEIPKKGRISVFDRSWYHRVTEERFEEELEGEALNGAFQDILSFEKLLSDDGTVVIKLFLYISKEEQRRRFLRLREKEETAWRVTEGEMKQNKHYKRYLRMCEEMLERTETQEAPWSIIEATDKNYASLKIMALVADRLEYELRRQKAGGEGEQEGQPVLSRRYRNGVLSGVDLTKSMEKEEYRERLDAVQKKLEFLHSEAYRLRIPVVLGFEGWDAAGKGGAIHRLTSHLDPRGYRVNPTASPNDEEKQHHYLWRFWNRMPKAGHIAIFDRTWYGRVMVERIEGFCSEAEWRRAYREINEMEAHMANFGAVVLKFWIHIDKDEQEKRFQERMADPDKQWKITEEDWRNREKWEEYEEAVNEMLIRTSTTYAPWIVVEGNSKYFARVKVLEAVAEAMEERIRQVKKGK